MWNRIKILCALLVVLLLTGCKTSRQPVVKTVDKYLSSKVVLTVPHRNTVLTVNGTMKLKSGELMQLSFLMPILRSEVARMEVTPDEILLVDRMGKRYVRTTRDEIKHLLPKEANFARLEKMLYAAAKPGAKHSISGSELGIPALEKGEIKLEDFSEEKLTMQRTQLSERYTQVTLEELLEMLISL